METGEAERPVLTALLARREELLAFVERRVGSPEVAEDILQDAFARGLDRIEALRESESAVAWFYRVLRNAIVDFYRRTATATAALERYVLETPDTVEPDAALRVDICRCVSRLAADLKPEYADALQRIDVDGVSVKDFAGERGITAGNAGVRVFRAREALRRQLSASCGACAKHACVDCHCLKSV